MDDRVLFDVATGSALNGLARASHLLGRISERMDADDLLRMQLVPDAFDCAGQIRTVTIFALRTVMPLMGQDWNLAVSGDDAETLLLQLDAARDQIESLTPEEFEGAADRLVTHRAGEADLTQPAQDYVMDFAIPNMWFHLSMAYAILRAAGLTIGKADFDGLHEYRAGFSFV